MNDVRKKRFKEIELERIRIAKEQEELFDVQDTERTVRLLRMARKKEMRKKYKGKIFTKDKRPDKKDFLEYHDERTKTTTLGYMPRSVRIQRLFDAGENLRAFREQFEFTLEKVPEDLSMSDFDKYGIDELDLLSIAKNRSTYTVRVKRRSEDDEKVPNLKDNGKNDKKDKKKEKVENKDDSDDKNEE